MRNPAKLISFFLTPATVALAIPIYRKLDVLLKNLLPILLGAFVGSMVSIGSVLLFSHLFGLGEARPFSRAEIGNNSDCGRGSQKCSAA